MKTVRIIFTSLILSMAVTFVACKPQVQVPKHEHNYVESDRKDASCTEDGYIEYNCINPNCDEPVKMETLLAFDHDYKEIACDGYIGCTGSALVTYKCDNCNHEYSDYVYGPGHDSYMIQHNEPLCTSDAQDLFGCHNCDDTWYDNYYPPLGYHDFGPDGKEEYCLRCGETNWDVIE